jgi:hypothetical protein
MLSKWTHPGGKIWELCADQDDDNELLAIFLSSSIKGKTALNITDEFFVIWFN